MKHLKKYNEVALYDNIRSNLEDICQELKDDGFAVYITYNNSVEKTSLVITRIDITAFRDTGEFLYTPFKFTDIEETVERVKEYMKSEGYETNILNGEWPQQIIKSSFRVQFKKID